MEFRNNKGSAGKSHRDDKWHENSSDGEYKWQLLIKKKKKKCERKKNAIAVMKSSEINKKKNLGSAGGGGTGHFCRSISEMGSL